MSRDEARGVGKDRGLADFSRMNELSESEIVETLTSLAHTINSLSQKLRSIEDEGFRHEERQTLATVPIPGTRNINHLLENLEAVHVELTTADIRELDAAFSGLKVHGGRMNKLQTQVVE